LGGSYVSYPSGILLMQSSPFLVENEHLSFPLFVLMILKKYSFPERLIYIRASLSTYFVTVIPNFILRPQGPANIGLTCKPARAPSY